ncbi:hypothetical protein PQX77_017803, partial [Marasmius sp. AFHP31]
SKLVMERGKPLQTVGSNVSRQHVKLYQSPRQSHESTAGISRQSQPQVFPHPHSPDPLTHVASPTPDSSKHDPSHEQRGYLHRSSMNLETTSSQTPFTITENFGNSNQTYNGSHLNQHCKTAVFYVFPNGSSSMTQSEQTPSTSPALALSNSQNSSPTFSHRIVSSPSSQVAESAARQIDNRMPGQRYASLLSNISLGHPLWKPSPRCTDTGEEYTVSIGDVGIYYDVYPFYTLFNITKPLGGITNGNQVPDGVIPHCDIHGSVTVEANCYEKGQWLIWPRSSLLEQATSDRGNSRVFTFHLSENEGALLVLPQGGTSRKLEKTYEFKSRILRYWRQWYDFANKEGDLDGSQSLRLVTGVEQCSTWAMAVWDAISTGSGMLGPLELTVDNISGSGSWTRCPPRCSTRSLASALLARDDNELRETIFVHAFWISRSLATSITSLDSPFPNSGYSDEGGDREDDSDRHHWNSRNPFNRSSNNPFRHITSTSAQPRDSSGHFDCSNSRLDHISRPMDNNPRHIQLPAAFDTVYHPCQLINRLAFEIISKAQPALLDFGIAAISHENDWLSVQEDFDDPVEAPQAMELLRRICAKFKFVAEGDAVYTEVMTPVELEIMQKDAGTRLTHAACFPVLLVVHPNHPGEDYLNSNSRRLYSDAAREGITSLDQELLQPKSINASGNREGHDRFSLIKTDNDIQELLLDDGGFVEVLNSRLPLKQSRLIADFLMKKIQMGVSLENTRKYSGYLQLLLKKHGTLPEGLYMNHTELVVNNTQPLRGKTSSDICKGTYQGQTVCIKVRKVSSNNQIYKEALLWALLRHENILHFCGLQVSNLGFVSPWMINGSIMQYLKKNPGCDRVTVIRKIAAAVTYLHSLEIVHGDIQPENILVDGHGNCRLANFGLAKDAADISTLGNFASSDSRLKGAIRYTAPELLRKENEGIPYFPAGRDIYAYGCTMYEVFTGKPPFGHLDWDAAIIDLVVRGYRPSRPTDAVWCSDKVWLLIEQCWSQDERSRPSAEAICAKLEEILGPKSMPQSFSASGATSHRDTLNNKIQRIGSTLVYDNSASGPQQSLIWNSNVFINGFMYGTGEGTTKAEAQERAAAAALVLINARAT